MQDASPSKGKSTGGQVQNAPENKKQKVDPEAEVSYYVLEASLLSNTSRQSITSLS